jgi:uncharacterized protein YccT (UPF0319 family)
MNIRKIVFLLVLQCLLVASTAAQAGAGQATLVVPEALDILKVDNTKYSGKLFSLGDKTVKLGPGLHRIVVEYEVIWDISTDEHERVWSEPFQIAFVAEAGKQYYIKVPAFTYLKQAQKYADKPEIKIIDRSTNQVVAAQVLYQEEDVNLLKFKQPAGSVVAAPSANAASFQQTAPVTTGNMPLQMLEYWWSQASEQQRKHFIESIKW